MDFGMFLNGWIMAAVVAVVEYFKKKIPQLPSVWYPELSAAVGVLISVLTNAGKIALGADGTPVLHPVLSIYTLIVGVVSGIAATASYSVAMNVSKNVGGSNSTPPVEPPK